MENTAKELLKNVPSVSNFFKLETTIDLVNEFGDGIAKFAFRELLNDLRQQIIRGKCSEIPSNELLTTQLRRELERLTSPDGRRAINASGIMLHTGLGRAPFCEETKEQMSTFNGYSVLQTDLKTGKRSLREEKIEKMLIELTGCEAVTVVNNNAAATMLILNTLAKGKEVIVSRGQLIEIGGAFRLPDVMEQSGVILREIGTTNRTHLRDYEQAVNENTGALIHVHTSNYRVRGFTGTPDIKPICELRKKLTCETMPYFIDDLGSGALVSLADYGLPNEPLVKESIAAGADVICFSGDKLICGAQSGIICGKKEIIQKIRKNPFARMFRVDKMTLAVLETTLIHFINGTYKNKIPFYKMLTADINELENKADNLLAQLTNLNSMSCSVVDDFSYIGSGSIPDEGVPTKVVKLIPKNSDPHKITTDLRMNIPSIFCRICDNSIYLDMRTLLKNDYDYLCNNLASILS